jgi:hypothetical protein
LRCWLAVFFTWILLGSGHSFSFDLFVREDVALSVFVRGLHEFVVGGINGFSLFIELVFVSITSVDSLV